jgi:hypothetical protein
MPFDIRPGESYVIRRKVFKIFGAAFHVYDPQGGLVGYCKQKAFKLREDIRIYTDESCSTEFLTIKARSIIDFGSTYDCHAPRWHRPRLPPPQGPHLHLPPRPLARLQRVRPPGRRAHRRWQRPRLRPPLHRTRLGNLPRDLHARAHGGEPIAKYRQHFNPFVYRLSVTVVKDDPEIDDLVILAAGCLIAAIEGRQSDAG